MTITCRRGFVAGLLCTGFLPPASMAQAGPIKIVYSFAAGGAGDTVARLLAEHLGQRLERPVMVNNVTGAGGLIGARSVKSGPADGSTVLFAAAAPMTLQPHIVANLGYDPFADFVAVSQVVKFDQVLAVGRDVPVSSMSELANWLRPNPDKVHSVLQVPARARIS